MTSLKEAALAYAARGWPVFPCNSVKEPYTDNGVLDATTNPEKIRAWWDARPNANIGLDVAGAGLMVLDFDPGHDMKQVEASIGRLPDTKLRARTPRGGEHRFYEIAPGEVISPSASKIAPHVDVRSFHSYVLLWPSKTADGPYLWEGEGKPAYRTDEMARVANSARAKHEDRDKWLIQPDLPENVASAIKWLKKDAKLAVEGQGGDAMAYATAAHLKSYGISETMALDLMWEHWNPRCVPPWNSDEFEHFETKVQNGYSYNTSPPGNITPAYKVAKAQNLFKPVERELPSGRELSSGKFRFADRAGMRHIRPPEWLIHDFLPSGAFALLVGAPGTFKTFVALDIALSVATGANFPWTGLWNDIGKTGSVLYVLGEGRPEFNKRVEAWERTHWRGAEVENIILADPVPLVSAGEDEWNQFIDGALALRPDGYELIVLDTVGRSMQGMNENAQENVSLLTQRAEMLQRALGGTMLALHHSSSGEDGAVKARGSSVFYGDPDTVIHLERPDKAYNVKLTMAKQKDAPEWGKPKWLKLQEVELAPKVTSLVAVKPPKEEEAAPENKVKKARQREQIQDLITLEILDKAVIDILKGNPTRRWSNAALADAVAMHPSVTIDSQSLRKSHLVRLREEKARHAHRCFDPTASRAEAWRYQP